MRSLKGHRPYSTEFNCSHTPRGTQRSLVTDHMAASSFFFTESNITSVPPYRHAAISASPASLHWRHRRSSANIPTEARINPHAYARKFPSRRGVSIPDGRKSTAGIKTKSQITHTYAPLFTADNRAGVKRSQSAAVPTQGIRFKRCTCTACLLPPFLASELRAFPLTFAELLLVVRTERSGGKIPPFCCGLCLETAEKSCQGQAVKNAVTKDVYKTV